MKHDELATYEGSPDALLLVTWQLKRLLMNNRRRAVEAVYLSAGRVPMGAFGCSFTAGTRRCAQPRPPSCRQGR